jgi:predicted RNA polymerase sigma factor
VGRFLLEAAIQAVHAQRAHTRSTDWEAVALLYDGLVRHAPSIGALVARAAAVAQARGVPAAWELLQELSSSRIETYQPNWTCPAHLTVRRGRREDAVICYHRANGLCTDRALREFLVAGLRATASGLVEPGPLPDAEKPPG